MKEYSDPVNIGKMIDEWRLTSQGWRFLINKDSRDIPCGPLTPEESKAFKKVQADKFENKRLGIEYVLQGNKEVLVRSQAVDTFGGLLPDHRAVYVRDESSKRELKDLPKPDLTSIQGPLYRLEKIHLLYKSSPSDKTRHR